MERSARESVFRESIAGRTARVGVVGLGYAGLPLAIAFADAGFAVTGIDVDPERVDAVNQRRSFLVDVPEHRYELEGSLEATLDYDVIGSLDAVVICVPTPLSKTRTPDLSFVVAAVEAVSDRLGEGRLLVLQSTTYPGTTTEILLPLLEARGFVAGRDVFVGYAPERIDPGNQRWDIKSTPRLVSGVTAACLERVVALYSTIGADIVPVSSTIVAETAKLHENTFRAVNIALANELAVMCDRMGVSVWEVIEAAGTKPFGFMPHYPGPGLGGDCIPIVPRFLSWRLEQYGYSSRLIEAAHDVNSAMPLYVVNKVADALNAEALPISGSRLVLLGVAYKPGVHDTRESPALEVMRELLARGGDVRYADPYVPSVEVAGQRHESVEWSVEEARAADCVIVLTPHDELVSVGHWADCRLIVDTRNAVPDGPRVFRL